MRPAATDLQVFVLAERGDDTRGSLAALAAAGVTGARVIELERAGAWAQARNAALEQAGAAAFVALVEAGVCVGPGWLDAWEEIGGDDSVGAAGGPVLAGGGTPGGIDAARHAQVLGLTGPDGISSGNAILRTAALRAAGGFAPARGHRAAVDGLADWQLALEAIAAAGWKVRRDDRLAATRDLGGLGYRALLARRLQTGARSAELAPETRPPRPTVAALRAAASAGARLARGDMPGAADRLAWAAASAGSSLGPVAAHRGLQPDATRTPWRPSVAAPQPGPVRSRLRRTPRAKRGARTVLLYHRVCDLADDPLAVNVTPRNFAAQMETLARSGRAATLEAVAGGSAPPGSVAVTFDDGYHDNLSEALPVLARTGVPATLFAATGQITRGEGFWWDTAGRLLAAGIAGDRPGRLRIELPEGDRAWIPGPSTPLNVLLGQVHAALRPRDAATIRAAIDRIADWAGQTPEPPDRDRPLTPEELRVLASEGPFDVQSHGRDHLSLALVPSQARADDLAAAAGDLEAIIGHRPTQLAYPFGVPGTDVDAATRQAAAAAGYSLAVVNATGRVEGADRLAVPRRAVPDIGGEEFSAWLEVASFSAA